MAKGHTSTTEVSTSLLECQENDAKMEDSEDKNIYVNIDNQIDMTEEVQSNQKSQHAPEEDTESTYYITPDLQPNPKGNFVKFLIFCKF